MEPGDHRRRTPVDGRSGVMGVAADLDHSRSAGLSQASESGCTGLSAWNDLVTTVLDELAVARRTGWETAHLAALRRASFAAFVNRSGLPDGVREWISIVVESETAVEWDRIAALDGVEEMSPFAARPAHPDGERNVRVAGGNQRVIAALAAGLPDDAIRLGARVRRVRDQAGGVEVAYPTAAC